MTAEDEIRSILDWIERTGHVNIAAALRRALAKWPKDLGEDAAPHQKQISGVTVADFIERGQRAQTAVDRILAAERRAKAPKRTA